MTKKIFRSIFIVAISVLFASIAIIMSILYDYFSSVQQNQLKAELTLAAEAVESQGTDYLNKFELDGCRLTWINTDGSILFDSIKSASEMENHSEREEIKQAFETGEGQSSRFSSTLTEKTLYHAKKLSNGTVLRISTNYHSIPALLLGMLQPIVAIFFIALIISIGLAFAISKKIVKPLENIDFERPLDNDTYDELSPVLTHMEQQRKRIKSQYNELNVKRNEFNTVTENLREGLVLLNKKFEIISINSAAKVFVGTDKNCTGEKFISVERDYEIDKAIKQAEANGKSELLIERAGREYQINISRVDTDDGPHGIAILIFDISDKAIAEQSRREFTANISHELKTPLQSIMGSAELLENGIVKNEDIAQFAGRIRGEAKRLVTLINDIIRLSQLDEKVALTEENVNLLELANDEISSLETVAAQKNVKITVSGDEANIIGVKQLCHEIIYNLCDNAIKYNVDGGKVDVIIKESNDTVTLTVSDTGVGISPEHQQRIFERFYRVDKSHSKASGGTGLGLSIVKHAAEYLNGTVKVESTVNKGTTFTVVLEK